jgi:hypothetical protein
MFRIFCSRQQIFLAYRSMGDIYKGRTIAERIDGLRCYQWTFEPPRFVVSVSLASTITQPTK